MSCKFTLVAACLSLATTIGMLSSAAASTVRQDSYCLQGRQSGFPGNCAFSTYKQCQAAASGTGEGCGINPMKASRSYHAYHGVY